MPSGKKSKQQRRAAAAAPPPVRSKGAPGRRQASPRVLAGAGGVVAVVAVVVILLVVLGGGSKGSGIPKGTPTTGNANGPAALPGAAQVQQLFGGIPQEGLYLGSPFAPVQMTIFIDLQCPFCQNYETTAMPTLVRKYVRAGKLRIKVEPWAFIGPDSFRGQKAMFAAAMQNKAWNFAENLYDNQRTENTGWLNDAMIAEAAASVTGLNVSKLFSDRNLPQIASEASAVSTAANAQKVTGTPTIFLGRNGQKQQLVGATNTVPTLAETESAIDAALAK